MSSSLYSTDFANPAPGSPKAGETLAGGRASYPTGGGLS